MNFKHVLLGIVLALLVSSSVVFAQVPDEISVQGRLTDSDDDPLSGSYMLTFRIYNSQAARTPIWAETHLDVDIQSGVFNIILGSVNPLDINFDKPYWLEVEVSDGVTSETLSPRVKITSSGFTQSAEKLLLTSYPVRVYGNIRPAAINGTSTGGIGIYGKGTNYAGYFEGKTKVTGDIIADGNIYEQGNDRVCTVENALCSAAFEDIWVNETGDTMTGLLTFDLTAKTGPAGRDAILIKASGDNINGVISVNKDTLTLWSTLGHTADLSVRNVKALGDVEVRGGEIFFESSGDSGIQLQVDASNDYLYLLDGGAAEGMLMQNLGIDDSYANARSQLSSLGGNSLWVDGKIKASGDISCTDCIGVSDLARIYVDQNLITNKFKTETIGGGKKGYLCSDDLPVGTYYVKGNVVLSGGDDIQYALLQLYAVVGGIGTIEYDTLDVENWKPDISNARAHTITSIMKIGGTSENNRLCLYVNNWDSASQTYNMYIYVYRLFVG